VNEFVNKNLKLEPPSSAFLPVITEDFLDIFLTNSLLSFAVLFVTSRGGGSLVQFNGKMYRKIKGTPYRSTYLCTEKNCEAQIIVNDLKGGTVKVIKSHNSRCMNWVKGKVVVTKSE
jgi:hypothetical protein